MAERCGDLYEVATVIDQFYSILGPELKGVFLWKLDYIS
jgi:dynein heavy chain